jgi:hypothetical protein
MKIGKTKKREKDFQVWECPYCEKETAQFMGDSYVSEDDVGCPHWAGNGVFVQSSSELDNPEVERAVEEGIAWKA